MRVAIVPPCFQRGQHSLDMVFQEQHGGNDDVGPCDVGMTCGQRRGIAGPFVRGVHRHAEVRQVLPQRGFGAREGTTEMTVHGHHDDAE